MIAIQQADTVDVYMPTANPQAANYLRYRMQRKPAPAVHSDVWRWNETWEFRRTGERTFTSVRRISTNGEVELAIRQNGKSDFMGGVIHGWEMLSSVTMLLDGVVVALGAVATVTHYPRSVEFVQASDLFEMGVEPLTRVAKVHKRWLFRDGQVKLSTLVEWEASITIDYAYLTMLPCVRTDVSDRAFRDPYYGEEDISVPGFPEVYSTSSRVLISGVKGYSAEVEVTQGWDKPGRRFHVENDPLYNKLYFDFTGPGYQTQVGEAFEASSTFRLDSRLSA
jgi:hypothetical protein